MTNLSPAALATWDAFNNVSERVGVFEDYGDALASALRTLVEHVHYDEHLDTHEDYEAKLLAIAAELESSAQ